MTYKELETMKENGQLENGRLYACVDREHPQVLWYGSLISYPFKD